MTEAWKPVVGFEGRYEVSDQGRVRSLDRVLTSAQARRGYPRKIKGQMIKLQVRPDGYLAVGRGKGDCFQLVHILVAEAFLGPRPPQHEVCHRDDVKAHNAVSNLYWGTRADNVADKRRNGRILCGEKNPCAILTQDAVEAIRRSHAPEKTLAPVYGVAHQTIGKVRRRESWRHV